jgi:D-alanyl-lipoteichoic acid acyltransferase DltB (MBOAT superfamily)
MRAVPILPPSSPGQEVPHRRFVPWRRATVAPGGAALAPLPRGLYAGEPETWRRDPRQFARILLHLALIVIVARVYRLEGRGFQTLLMVAAAALPVHYWVPLRFKAPLFVAASIVGLVLVFGAATAAVVLPIAAVLIGLCYLPVRWSIRAALVGLVALGCAGLRAGLVPNPLGTALGSVVWPVLGTMFMFRMIVYLYELKHAKRPERLIDTLSYFFLLPNYCFLHFPVVDYKTFLRGFGAVEIHAVQRRGLSMIVRGITHLLLYRLVYHLLLISPDDVTNLATLGRYVVCTYLLYLRVSGQFHVACGMLHLFGYQLPETHHHYLLATGFTDYWRRINIYWKDFMVRVVFNPVVFRMKKRPQIVALSVATLVVFVTTWALHAYQSFWLRGRWGFSVPDALFWGVLGVLVMINVRNDARNPRRGVRGKATVTPRGVALRAVKTLGTFTTLAVLWSLWSSPSLASWLGMLHRAGLGSGLWR